MLRGLGYIGQETIESAVQSLKEKGAQFMGAYGSLMSLEERAAAYPDLHTKWKSLKSEGDKIKSSVQYIANIVDSVGGFLGRTFGLSGMGAMGVFPLIPIAVVTGAIAAISAFVYAVSNFSDSLTKREMVEKGYSGKDIGMSSQTMLGDVSTIVKYVAIAGFGIIVLPKLLEAFKR